MERLQKQVAEKVVEVFGGGARLAGLHPLAGDASSRRYFRAVLQPPAAPSSVIVMTWTDVGMPISSDELAVFSEPLDELPFLNVHRFLKAAGTRVPAVHGHWVEQGLMLLEDLGDVCLWDRVREAPEAEVIRWYRKAIDELLVLQIGGTRIRNDQCMAFRQAFDRRLYLWEFAHFIEYGLEAGDQGSLPKTERRILDMAFEGIAGHLSGRPRVLNHRDYHSWNLMVHNDAVVVIDFQDALLAPAQYDLASLLNDRETDQVVTRRWKNNSSTTTSNARKNGESPGRTGTHSGRLTCWPPCNGISRWWGVSGTSTWSRANRVTSNTSRRH